MPVHFSPRGGAMRLTVSTQWVRIGPALRIAFANGEAARQCGGEDGRCLPIGRDIAATATATEVLAAIVITRGRSPSVQGIRPAPSAMLRPNEATSSHITATCAVNRMTRLQSDYEAYQLLGIKSRHGSNCAKLELYTGGRAVTWSNGMIRRKSVDSAARGDAPESEPA